MFTASLRGLPEVVGATEINADEFPVPVAGD
jgi:hypothetical protein